VSRAIYERLGDQRRAVAPLQVVPQVEGVRQAVLGDAAVLNRRNLGGDIRFQFQVWAQA
jgi:hypothetical protein